MLKAQNSWLLRKRKTLLKLQMLKLLLKQNLQLPLKKLLPLNKLKKKLLQKRLLKPLQLRQQVGQRLLGGCQHCRPGKVHHCCHCYPWRQWRHAQPHEQLAQFLSQGAHDPVEACLRQQRGHQGGGESGSTADVGLLIWAATFAWALEHTPCRAARLLAIRDDERQHRRLVRYFRGLGFTPLREVGAAPRDLPLRLVWGGAGLLMRGDCAEGARRSERWWLRRRPAR